MRFRATGVLLIRALDCVMRSRLVDVFGTAALAFAAVGVIIIAVVVSGAI